MEYQRGPVDIKGYIADSQHQPCFICRLASGQLIEPHTLIYEDDQVIVFFSKHQLLYGYVLVAPRQHKEHVTRDFSMEEYLALQRIIYRVAQALQQEVNTERLYILSLGSQQGNRHVHWHLAPLPPGIPYEAQQLAALNLERGVLDIPAQELADLAERLRQRILSMEP